MASSTYVFKSKRKDKKKWFFFWETFSSVGSQKQGQLRSHKAKLQKSNRERRGGSRRQGVEREKKIA